MGKNQIMDFLQRWQSYAKIPKIKLGFFSHFRPPIGTSRALWVCPRQPRYWTASLPARLVPAAFDRQRSAKGMLHPSLKGCWWGCVSREQRVVRKYAMEGATRTKITLWLENVIGETSGREEKFRKILAAFGGCLEKVGVHSEILTGFVWLDPICPFRNIEPGDGGNDDRWF